MGSMSSLFLPWVMKTLRARTSMMTPTQRLLRLVGRWA